MIHKRVTARCSGRSEEIMEEVCWLSSEDPQDHPEE